ncbi:MAG: hypothetical protein J3K34DRAFT_455584 [Monoraphidium minutum]|nr:MAG: hypothetical protein J3K34DRAFT_455584 [Monoraphidium minutum]
MNLDGVDDEDVLHLLQQIGGGAGPASTGGAGTGSGSMESEGDTEKVDDGGWGATGAPADLCAAKLGAVIDGAPVDYAPIAPRAAGVVFFTEGRIERAEAAVHKAFGSRTTSDVDVAVATPFRKQWQFRSMLNKALWLVLPGMDKKQVEKIKYYLKHMVSSGRPPARVGWPREVGAVASAVGLGFAMISFGMGAFDHFKQSHHII